VVRIYCSREKPLYLPYYVPDRIFSIEVVKTVQVLGTFLLREKEETIHSTAMENWGNFIKKCF
jgi:hypothetical protein